MTGTSMHPIRVFVRWATTQRKSVSIIGSGPSGFYTACRLLSKSPIPLDVTLWEKLPVPFGLSRYGVAPDHPEVKNCEQTFTEYARKYLYPGVDGHTFRFRGNVTIGKDLELNTLMKRQDAVILSYGCSGDHKLGIPGEDDTKGVFTSREIVNWYNGHPDFAKSEKLNGFDWESVRKVGIIGNGNVALDLARVLLSCRENDIWAHTDINPFALSAFRRAPIQEVKLIARRDFVHSKFTNKEYRELWELEQYGIRGFISDQYFDASKIDLTNADRVQKRRVEMTSEYLKPFNERTKKNYRKFPPPAAGFKKHWEMDYLKTPLRINSGADGKLKSLTVCPNILSADSKIEPLAYEEIDYDMDVLITSLGYGSSPLVDFPSLNIGFAKNHVYNDRGMVLNTQGSIIPGLYVSGWIKKGSSGVIASTMADAFEVADMVITDLRSVASSKSRAIDISGVRFTTWKDWEKIDLEEKARGKFQNKIRDKFIDTNDILAFLREEIPSSIEDGSHIGPL